MAMEKPNIKQDQRKICTTTNVVVQLQALKCPRCDSSNTKFCYYNNYSLTQPRHFCKACKRYWTRGGTLRNVPVGGSCRKNKRIRRPSISNHSISSINLIPTTTTTHMEQQQLPSSSSSNPFFYNLPSASNTSDLVNHLLYPNPTDLGLGFSPLVNVLDNSLLSTYINHNNRPMFSSFDQQKPFSGSISDMLKTDQEEGQNRLEWNYQLAQMDQSDSSSLYNWNTSSSSSMGTGGSWLDPVLQNIIGSSVPSLI